MYESFTSCYLMAMKRDYTIAKFDIHHAIAFAAVSGVLSHLLFFLHGEHHMKAPILLRLSFISLLLLIYIKVGIMSQDAASGVVEVMEIFASYILSLFTSIAVYRRFFHRLHKFPGPPAASLTKLWQTYYTLDSQNHVLLDGLYRKYGDFVRTGE